MIALNWALRDHLHLLRDDGRLAVLTALSLHCNDEMRCFPSIDTLVAETGYSRPTVNKAKKWLLERGVIALVPYANRKGDKEKGLPVRSHVYKLTGFIRIESDEDFKKGEKKVVQYLVMSLDDVKGIRKFLEDTNTTSITSSDLAWFESKLSELSKGESKLSESSPTESSLTLPKGLYSSKGLSSSEGEEEAPTPAPVSDKYSTVELSLYALIQAWCYNTDASVPFNEAMRKKNYLSAAEKLLDIGATPEEVIECTKSQVPKNRAGAYMFWFLEKDLPEWREQNKDKVQQKKLDNAGADTLARQRAAMAEITALKQTNTEAEDNGAA